MNIKKIHLALLCVLSAVILTLAWPARGFAPLLFIGFIPLFFVEEEIYQNKKRKKKERRYLPIFGFSFITFFIFNMISMYWLCYLEPKILIGFGAAFANAIFMTVSFTAYHKLRRWLKLENTGLFLLIAIWLGFELLHQNWDLTFPWFNLGNGFANMPYFIQWYQFTGASGGTIWILLANIIGFKLIKSIIYKENETKRFAIILSSIIIIPISISLIQYFTYTEKGEKVEIAVIQPNIDPYAKFVNLSTAKQIDTILYLAEKISTQNTDLVLCPETAIPENLWEDDIIFSASANKILKFNKQHPNTNFLIGANTAKIIKDIDTNNMPFYVTYNEFYGFYYSGYNSAIIFDTSSNVGIYHKSKLAPFVEKMPFPHLLDLIGFSKISISMGGISRSNGIDKERTVFTCNDTNLKAAPIICYESVYSDFVTEYVRKGASILCIITNDGWWGDTPGYKQHFQQARIRAIENRRSVARSANTGTSGFINQRGDIIKKTDYWVVDTQLCELQANTKLTFFSKHGDYFGRMGAFSSIFLLIYGMAAAILRKIKNKKTNE